MARIKGCSPNTIKVYRDAFRLLLPFAARHHRLSIERLNLEHIDATLLLAFLDHLEVQCRNSTRTRNLRLATVKSFAKMIRLFYPDQRRIVQTILDLPQKRIHKPLIGFLNQDEMMRVFTAVDMKKTAGVRDYTILHLLYDSGARASEVAGLNLDYFDYQQKSLALLGKGNRFRLVQLWPLTADLLRLYCAKYRQTPKPLYRHVLFINQRGEQFTRYGINRLCHRSLQRALPDNRVKQLNPVHCFRHSCAVNMLRSGDAISDIKNRLGHESIQSTMMYLHMDLSCKREVQNKFIAYTKTILPGNEKIEELIDWENKQDTLKWLDSL
jgi:integrase/recombinase XerD